jgi:putative membrane protein
MRKFLALSTVACGAAALVACSNEDGRNAVDRTQDAVAAGVGQVSANTMGANSVEAYVTGASTGDLYEIRAADLALQHASSDQVKALARMIKTDHTEASEKLKALVDGRNDLQPVAVDLDERRKGMLDNLANAEKPGFDRAWLEQQVDAHEEAVALHNGFANNADHPELSAHARTVLPKIQAHLNSARELLVSSHASQ